MKTPYESEVRIRDVFNEEELAKFQSESIKVDDSSNLLFHNNTMNKADLKALIFKVCRSQLKDSYLRTALNWLEEDSKERTKEQQNEELTKLKAQNDFYKSSLTWINDNCSIKLNPTSVDKFPSLPKKELTIQAIKNHLKAICKTKKDDLSLAVKPDKFITFSEESINKIETPDFNIFKLEEEVGAENTLSVVGCYIFTSYGLYSIIKYNKFEKFVQEITRGYIRSNPYHNDLHAADVTQTCMIYLKYAKIKEFLKLNDLDLCSTFIACMVHDYKHPGYNNPFLQNTNDLIAIRYNDTSILESYHISQTFKLIRSNEAYNIFASLSNEDYRNVRKRMIGLVIATDMVFHFKQFGFLKDKIATYSITKGENRDKIVAAIDKPDKIFTMQQDFLEIIIHACDISNPTKPFDIYTFWADKVVNEFWRQGDKEKSLGLKVSMNCDRNTTTKAQCQVGFMDFIVGPFFGSFAEIFPELTFLVDNVKNNTTKFKQIKEEEDRQKKEKEGNNSQ